MGDPQQRKGTLVTIGGQAGGGGRKEAVVLFLSLACFCLRWILSEL